MCICSWKFFSQILSDKSVFFSSISSQLKLFFTDGICPASLRMLNPEEPNQTTFPGKIQATSSFLQALQIKSKWLILEQHYVKHCPICMRFLWSCQLSSFSFTPSFQRCHLSWARKHGNARSQQWQLCHCKGKAGDALIAAPGMGSWLWHPQEMSAWVKCLKKLKNYTVRKGWESLGCST